MERRTSYAGCVFAASWILVAYLWLSPVFYQAREAAWESRRFDDGLMLARTLKAYADAHHAKLPGAAWTAELEKVEPGFAVSLYREVDGKHLGYAAIPGVLGRKLDDLDSETVLFVESRTGRENEIARDLSELGGRLDRGTAVAVTVENVLDGTPVAMTPLVRIGMQLQRQGAPGLR